jgi:hypothetical protein
MSKKNNWSLRSSSNHSRMNKWANTCSGSSFSRNRCKSRSSSSLSHLKQQNSRHFRRTYSISSWQLDPRQTTGGTYRVSKPTSIIKWSLAKIKIVTSKRWSRFRVSDGSSRGWQTCNESTRNSSKTYISNNLRCYSRPTLNSSRMSTVTRNWFDWIS